MQEGGRWKYKGGVREEFYAGRRAMEVQGRSKRGVLRRKEGDGSTREE